MSILVGRQFHHDVVTDFVQHGSGVAVRNTSRKFLHSHVAHSVGSRFWFRNNGAAHLSHSTIFKFSRLYKTAHSDVIAHHDCVTSFFCSPTLRPCSPRRLSTKHARNGARVPRQIVFGEEVHQESRPNTFGQLGLAITESVGEQTLGAIPGHIIVWVPIFGTVKVTIQETLCLWFKFGEKGEVVHTPNLVPYQAVGRSLWPGTSSPAAQSPPNTGPSE